MYLLKRLKGAWKGFKNPERDIKDAMTGLLNTTALKKIWPKEAAEAERYELQLSWAFLDIDDFKEINDSHGHVQGDKALKELADTVREVLRAADIPFRYGGDEFFVIFPETSKADAARAMIRLEKELEELDFLEINGISISWGVAEWQEIQSDELEEAVNIADERLYKMKFN